MKWQRLSVALCFIILLVSLRTSGKAAGLDLMCDGVTDMTAALQYAITAAIANQEELELPSEGCVVSATIVVQAAQNFRLRGKGSTGEGQLAGSRLIWNGPNGGTVLLFDRTRDSAVDNLTIAPGTGAIGIGLRVDHVAPPSGSFLSTHNIFRNVSILAPAIGVQIGNTSTQNNEFHEFHNLYVIGCTQYCVHIQDGQSKNIKFFGGALATRGRGAYGIHTVRGSFVTYATTFSMTDGHGVAIHLGDVTDTILISKADSEGASRFLETSGPSGAAFSVEIANSRLSPADTLPSDNCYIDYKFKGPLILRGNHFDRTGSADQMLVSLQTSTPGAVFMSLGNIYPNGAPFAPSGNQVYLSTMGDMWCSPTACLPLGVAQ